MILNQDYYIYKKCSKMVSQKFWEVPLSGHRTIVGWILTWIFLSNPGPWWSHYMITDSPVSVDLLLQRGWWAELWYFCCHIMMAASNGIIFRVTGPLCGGIHRSPVNSSLKSQWRGALVCFLWSALEQTVEEIIEAPVIWDAIAPTMTSL